MLSFSVQSMKHLVFDASLHSVILRRLDGPLKDAMSEIYQRLLQGGLLIGFSHPSSLASEVELREAALRRLWSAYNVLRTLCVNSIDGVYQPLEVTQHIRHQTIVLRQREVHLSRAEAVAESASMSVYPAVVCDTFFPSRAYVD
jgi:hypothetical protein